MFYRIVKILWGESGIPRHLPLKISAKEPFLSYFGGEIGTFPSSTKVKKAIKKHPAISNIIKHALKVKGI